MWCAVYTLYETMCSDAVGLSPSPALICPTTTTTLPAQVAAVRAGENVLLGIAACWIGLFAPGIMLIYGVLPFWGAFRSDQARPIP